VQFSQAVDRLVGVKIQPSVAQKVVQRVLRP